MAFLKSLQLLVVPTVAALQDAYDGGGAWNVVCNASINSACPEGNTCCPLVLGDFGCCPTRNATCCANLRTCCPPGSTCTNDASGYGGCTPQTTISSVLELFVPVPIPHQRNTNQHLHMEAGLPQQPTIEGFLAVSSIDGSTTLLLDEKTGELRGLQRGTHTEWLRGSTGPAGSSDHLPEISVQRNKTDGSVMVQRRWPNLLMISEHYVADPTSLDAVEWRLRLQGLNREPYSLPLSSTFNFSQPNNLNWWAPWDRLSWSRAEPWVDPLLPADGHSGFWEGEYNLGSVFPNSACDMVVAPLVAILSPAARVGFSLQLSPEDPPTAWAEASLLGHSGGFSWQRRNLRLASDTALTMQAHWVSHTDCWRPALGWHVARYSRHWKPVAKRAALQRVDGLGSYGSFPIPELNVTDGGAAGSLADPRWKRMNYKVNWDLSGRFYHYMGMYAPPPPTESTQDFRWLNRWNPFGARGGRLPYNVSYASIDELYAEVQSHGFSTLSYCNVFEFGMNVRHPLPQAQPPAWDDFRNATKYAANQLRDAVLGPNWNEQAGITSPSNPGAWDDGVLMDPGVASYKAEMVAQTARRKRLLANFQGLVVDRSDYARYYSLTHNDGVSFVNGTMNAWSLKRSYLDVIAAIRAELGNNFIMLMNSLGFASISMMQSYDGTFSEGKAVNAVGLLSAGGMPAILWTANAAECCSSVGAAHSYFQRRLLLGVYPMAPVPFTDHCISSDPAVEPFYEAYGPLFSALQGKTWDFTPHAVHVLSPSGAKANAFVINTSTRIYPLVLVHASRATLRVAGLDAPAVRFEAAFPGSTAQRWMELSSIVAVGNGVWEIVVDFTAALRSNFFGVSNATAAALIRASISSDVERYV